MGQLAHDLTQLERLDPSLSQERELVDALTHQVDDLAHTLRSYRDSIEYNPDRLRELEGRLALIRDLRRKYGTTIAEILAFAERASDDLERLSNCEERAAGLKAREIELVERVGGLAGQLSEARRHAASHLAHAIEEEIAELAVEHTQVYVDIRQADSEDGVPVRIGDGGPCSGLLDEEIIRCFAFNGTGIDSRRVFDLAELGRTAATPGQNCLRGRGFQVDACHKDHPVYCGPDPNLGFR